MADANSIYPCVPLRHKFKDLTGRRFGKLIVREFAGYALYANGKKKRYVWKCECDCGREAFVPTTDLNLGETKSCGCLKEKRRRFNRPHAYTENRLFLDSILRQVPCSKCGESDYRCLDFHHRDDSAKGHEISRLTSWGRKTLLTEIEKCDILCKNCHLRAHAQDGVVRFWKGEFKPGKPKPRPLSDKVDPRKREYMRRYSKQPQWQEYNRRYQRERYRKNKAIVDNIKADRGCEVCGEKDAVCLQFHHRDPEERTAIVASLCGFSSHRLMAEIDKCAVLCGNCHCKRHFEERRQPRWARKRRVRQLELPFDGPI